MVLTKPGEHFYSIVGYYTYNHGYFINIVYLQQKITDRLCLLALITTGIFYFWSFSKIDFISWEENQLLAILEENNLGDGSIFTVYNHSWLYLKTDRIPLIKSQFMKDLTFPTYVEKKKVITQVQDIKPDL